MCNNFKRSRHVIFVRLNKEKLILDKVLLVFFLLRILLEIFEVCFIKV